MSDGSDDLKKSFAKLAGRARDARRDARAFAATLEPVWAALDDAAAMEVSPGIATAGGARPPRARGIWVCITHSRGVDVKSILPVVEARFALPRRWRGRSATPRRRASWSATPRRRADASRARTRRPSMRLRALTGTPNERASSRDRLRETMREADRCTSPAPDPRRTRADDERFAGPARWPARVRAGGRASPARGARRVPRRPAPRRRFARPTPRSRAWNSPTRTGRCERAGPVATEPVGRDGRVVARFAGEAPGVGFR